MTTEEKCEAVWMNRMNGMPVKSIAAFYGVSSSTVYRLLDQGVKIHRQGMENKPAADIIAESLIFMRRCRDIFMFEANQSGAGAATVDPDTGAITREASKGNDQNKQRMLEGALKAEKLAVDLMKDTGIIPKEAEKIFHTLKGDDSAEVVEKHPDDRSEEEILKDINELIKRGRRI